MYPVNAIDLFIYAVRSRVFTAHAANPQAVPPAAFPDDPLMAFASAEWADDLSPYGPLWTLVAAPATALAGDDLGPALALYKLLAVAAVLAGGWLVFAVVRAEAPARAPAAALAYLWNPLVLWEGAGNGHNDALLAVPLLLALLAWVRRDDVLVPAWLAVGGALKYVSLPLLPLAVIAVWRRGGPGHGRARRLALGLASAAAVGMLSLAPFFDPSATLRSALAQGSIALTSPPGWRSSPSAASSRSRPPGGSSACSRRRSSWPGWRSSAAPSGADRDSCRGHRSSCWRCCWRRRPGTSAPGT
jgi:hypothetical protein